MRPCPTVTPAKFRGPVWRPAHLDSNQHQLGNFRLACFGDTCFQLFVGILTLKKAAAFPVRAIMCNAAIQPELILCRGSVGKSTAAIAGKWLEFISNGNLIPGYKQPQCQITCCLFQNLSPFNLDIISVTNHAKTE